MVAYIFFAHEMHRIWYERPPSILAFAAMENVNDSFGFFLLKYIHPAACQDSVAGASL